MGTPQAVMELDLDTPSKLQHEIQEALAPFSTDWVVTSKVGRRLVEVDVTIDTGRGDQMFHLTIERKGRYFK